jgi:hypothetical protein
VPTAILEHEQRDERGRAGSEQEPDPDGPALASSLKQREGDRDDRAGEQRRAKEIGTAGLRLARLGHDPDRRDECDERDRDVDQEDREVETTQMYLHADLAVKERALARTKPLNSKPGRYRPPDALLRFLDGL